jgi:hypothetical protein
MSFCSIILIETLVPTENIIRKKYTINSRSLAYYTYHCIVSVIIIIRCMVHPNLGIVFEFLFSFFSFSLSLSLSSSSLKLYHFFVEFTFRVANGVFNQLWRADER